MAMTHSKEDEASSFKAESKNERKYRVRSLVRKLKKRNTNLYDTLHYQRERTNPSKPTKSGVYRGEVTDRANNCDRERPENDKSRCHGVRNGHVDLQHAITNINGD
jgi:hypothetical protein